MSITRQDGQDAYAGRLREIQAISTAGGGTALTTGAFLVTIPKGVNYLSITPRNFTGATVIKYSLNPYLLVFKTINNLATYTDYSSAVQDGVAATVADLSSLPTFANGGMLLIGSHFPFRGAYFTNVTTNSTNSVLTVNYWNGSAWASITASDGTASGGKTMAQSGAVSWTVPGAWAAVALKLTTGPTPTFTGFPSNVSADQHRIMVDTPMYWTQWVVSAALDASTSVSEIIPYNRATSYAEYLGGQPLELHVLKDIFGETALELLTDAGTANVIINAGQREGGVGIGL